jgi:Tfp pilus assembly protein PilF
VFLLYANSLQNGFVFWDDPRYITENPFIRELSWNSVRQIFSIVMVENYAPLTILSYAIDYHFWGLNPRGYHITNLLLYLIDTLLVYFLASRIFRQPLFSFLTTLLFLTHPLHVEAVTWLSARKDVLSAAFFLFSLLLFARYLDQSETKDERRKIKANFVLSSFLLPPLYFGALLSLIMALLSKATTLSLPLVLVLYGHCFALKTNQHTEASFWRKIGTKLFIYGPFFLIGSLLTFLHLKVFHDTGIIEEHQSTNLYSTLLTLPKVLWYYIRLFFVPIHLSTWYDISVATSILEWSTLFPLFMIVLIFGATVKIYTFSKRTFFAIIWFFITILPVANLVRTSTLVADRYMLIPSVGLSILLGMGLENFYYLRNRLFSSNFIRVATLSGTIFLLLFYSVMTIQQNRVWHSDYNLWSDAVEKAPGSYIAHHNLGVAYFRAGQIDASIEEYKKALAIKPTGLGPRLSLGISYAEKNLLEQAEVEFKELLNLSPWYVEAYYNLGLIYTRQGLWDKAIEAYRKALELKPNYVEAHNNLGSIYYQKGFVDEAIEEFNQALKLNPEHVKALNNLKMARSQKGFIDRPSR